MKVHNGIFLLSTLAMLASCGGPAPAAASSSAAPGGSTPVASSTNPVSESGQPAPSSVVSSAEELPDNVRISFWSTGSQGMNDTISTLARSFEKAIKDNLNKTVTVNISVEGGYDDIANKLNKGYSDGTLPNMAVAYPDTVAGIIGSEPKGKEYLYDISKYMDDPVVGFGKQSYLGDTKEAGKKDIVPAFLDEGAHFSREGIYSYPFMKSSEVMFYNKDYVETAYSFYKPDIHGEKNIHNDLSNMNWAEFENLLTSVMEHKADINDQLENACYYDSDSNWFISHMYQNEIPYTDIQDGKGVISFESGENRTKAENMLSSFRALREDGRMNTKGVTGEYGSNYFKDEKILFSIGSSGGAGYQMPEGMRPEEIDVVPVPAAKGNKAYVSQGPTLTFIKNPTYQDDKQNDAEMLYSWMFAKYLTNTENNAELCVRGSQGYIPIRYSSYETDTFMSHLNANTLYAKSGKVVINEIAGHYYNAPVFPGSAQLRDDVGGALTSVITGEKTASKALTDAIEHAKTFMK